MTGSLQRKGEKWYVVTRLPDKNGNKKQVWISTKTEKKREALDMKAHILCELEKNNPLLKKKDEELFVNYLESWIKSKRHSVKENTLESYQACLKTHIIPYFAPLKLKLTEVTPLILQEYFNTKLEQGQTPNSLKHHRTIINQALREAVLKGELAHNPIGNVTLPSAKKYKGQAYSIDHLNALFEAVKGSTIEPAVILAAIYGLRREEVLGLRWQDIDFESGTFTVQNTVTRYGKELIVKEATKTAASNRTLPLREEDLQYLKGLKKQQELYKSLFGDEYTNSGYVCTYKDGRILNPDYLSHKFSKTLEKTGLPSIRFHDLRHTTASMLISKGVNVKVVQNYLGHEDVSTTLNIYTHIDTSELEKATQAMNEILISSMP